MRIGFDIGGVISRYPRQMWSLISALKEAGHEIFIITDMNPEDAHLAIQNNGFGPLVGPGCIISCNWSKYGDLCKAIAMREVAIDMMFDDRPDYIAEGVPIGFCLMPRPGVPYYDLSWTNKGTPAVCVPPEEYEAFKKWKES